jgi:hypothetical protein
MTSDVEQLRAENARLKKALSHLGFDTDLDAWANLKGAVIDMEHRPHSPPDSVCWATLNRVLGQLMSARIALGNVKE